MRINPHFVTVVLLTDAHSFFLAVRVPLLLCLAMTVCIAFYVRAPCFVC